jgi:hypothetical protein
MKRMKFISLLSLLILIGFNGFGQKDTTLSKSEFKPSGKLWGYVFGDYNYKTHADSLSRGKNQYAGKSYPKGSDAFAFRRIYLGYDYNISEKFSTELLLAHESDAVDAGGDRVFFIKAANLRWKNIIHNNDLIFGQMATPVFALMSEKVWAYRSVEKTIIDMRGLASSNDFGIAWQGKLNDKGDFGYNFMVANGTAQKLENDKYKKVYGEVYAKFMDQQIIVDVTSDYEPTSATQSKTTIHGMIAYQTDPITLGIEVFSQTQKNYAVDSINGTKINANVVPFGFSAFLRGQIVHEKLNYFARADSYNPDNKYDNSNLYTEAVPYPAKKYSETFITAGLDFKPVKNVHIIPNLWLDTYKSKLNNVSGMAKNDYDMVARLTVYYIFK